MQVTLICGKLCSGKTTYAHKLRREQHAVLLSCDEITLALTGLDAGEAFDGIAARTQAYLYGKAAEIVLDAARELCPDAILCVGQAGGRSAITPELVGINLRNGNIPDNNGNQPRDEEIIAGGDKAYFSTLPVRKMAEAVNAAGISSQVSYSAGAYVCNDVLYSILAHFEGTKTRAAFVHIPYCKEQNKEPSMEMEQIIRALTVAIENMD